MDGRRGSLVTEWNSDLMRLRGKVVWLEIVDQVKYHKILDDIENKITSYQNTSRIGYQFITDTLQRLEREISKLAWEGKIRAIYQKLTILPYDKKSCFVTQSRKIRELIKAHTPENSHSNQIEAELNKLNKSIDDTIKRHHAATIQAQKAEQTGSLCAIFCCFSPRKVARQRTQDEILDEQTVRLFSPVGGI